MPPALLFLCQLGSINAYMAAINRGSRSMRGTRIALWLLMLSLGQLADLLTTQAAMARGAVEANSVAASVLSTGGLGLLWVVKGSLVLAMGVAVLLVRRYWLGTERRGHGAGAPVRRGPPLSVGGLAPTAGPQLRVIGALPGARAPAPQRRSPPLPPSRARPP